jgi:hypothetical protein
MSGGDDLMRILDRHAKQRTNTDQRRRAQKRSSRNLECSTPFDKNSVLGRVSILKRQLYVKGILAQDLGFVWESRKLPIPTGQ